MVDLWVAKNTPGFASVTCGHSSNAEKALLALNGTAYFDLQLYVEFKPNRSQNEEYCPITVKFRYLDSTHGISENFHILQNYQSLHFSSRK